MIRPTWKAWLCSLALLLAASSQAMPLNSQHAILVNNEQGQVLLEKNADEPVPIASLTKLMTAMTVLDSQPDMKEPIAIDHQDVDRLKQSSSRVPVGTTLPRQQVLQLALMSSDNRAAAALARTYPGGMEAFIEAVQRKLKELGMHHTVIYEPTGLSPDNISTAADLAKMAVAASRYPQIANITTDTSATVHMKRRVVEFHNTNRLVGAKGWDILMSKTGFTNEAGHCLVMRIRQAGKDATLVLLNARATASTRADALKMRRWLADLAKSAQGRGTQVTMR
jgi:D-alanyl-D-alanine endopeptidase (penicillin-binding protein 7)